MKKSSSDFRQFGFSLMELVVSLGISSIVILGGMRILEMNSNVGKTVSEGLTETSFFNIISKTMSDNTSCNETLTGLIIDPISNQGIINEVKFKKIDIKSIWDINVHKDEKAIVLDNITIKKAVLEKFTPISITVAGERPYLAKFSMYGTKKGNPVPIPALSFYIKVTGLMDSPSNPNTLKSIKRCGFIEATSASAADIIQDVCEKNLLSQYLVNPQAPLVGDVRDPQIADPLIGNSEPHEIEGYCKKPYTFTTKKDDNVDSLNSENLKIVDSLFMAVKNKQNKTLKNALYIGRYLEDTFNQQFSILKTTAGVTKCLMYKYSYQRVYGTTSCSMPSTLPTGTNWGTAPGDIYYTRTSQPQQSVCVNLVNAGEGTYDTASKECTRSGASDIDITFCSRPEIDCHQGPPGKDAYISVMLMDKKEMYAAKIGNATNRPTRISTATCDLETGGSDCTIAETDASGKPLLDYAFYSLIDTQYYSDRRYKTDIKDLKESNILKLQPKTYSWKNSKEKSIGFIAQDMEKTHPLLVNQEKNYKTINQVSLLPQILVTLKGQNNRIQNLEMEINNLIKQSEKNHEN